MTVPSRVMGGTNAHWRGLAERRLQEARVRGEVVAEEEGGGGDRDGSCVVERGDGGKEGGGEKRVRWREREWAVLAGSESGVGSVGGGKV